jgi:hypothetical protein
MSEKIVNINDPLELAKARITYRASNWGTSKHLCNVIVELVESIAKTKNINLDLYDMAAETILNEEFAEREAARTAKRIKDQQDDLARRAKKYVKKHGHEPFSHGEEVTTPCGKLARVAGTHTNGRYTVELDGWNATFYGGDLTKANKQ